MTARSEVQAAAAYLLSARRYIPTGDASLATAAAVLDAAGVWSPGEVAERPPLPPVELVLVGRFCANGRARTLYRIVIDGREIGTAAQFDNRPTAPWSLTVRGYCANRAHESRAAVLRTVRLLLTGQM
jgi:hypothetical protein